MSKYHIVPACLPYTEDELQNFLQRWQGHASHIHIDCVGEKYSVDSTPTLSWRREVELLKDYKDDFAKIELHIMDVHIPRDQILEIHSNLPSALIFCKEIHHNVCPEISHPYILGNYSHECADALCMTIDRIGVQGEDFMYDHLGELASFIERAPFENIHIDGGINKESIKEVVERMNHGGNTAAKHVYFTVGSYLLGDDYLEKYTQLHNLFPSDN